MGLESGFWEKGGRGGISGIVFFLLLSFCNVCERFLSYHIRTLALF